MGTTQELIDPKKLAHGKLLDEFRRRLAGVHALSRSAVGSELLQQVSLGLAAEACAKDFPHCGGLRLAQFAPKLTLADGTRIAALPRMHWAQWVAENNRAAKLHLKFSGLRQNPTAALIPAGNRCERKALRKFDKRGETIVADRHYDREYGFLEQLQKMGVAFVIRLRRNPLIEIINEMPLAAADCGVGITCQGLVSPSFSKPNINHYFKA